MYYNKNQLRMGKRIEMEHTDNPKVAERIAKDHLREFPEYYTELNKMEKGLKKKKEREEHDGWINIGKEAMKVKLPRIKF